MSKTRVTFKAKPAPSTAPKVRKLQVPALSVPLKQPPIDPTLERLRKKTIRRNAPQGEDIKKIKEILKELSKETISVQEYVGLISPYTADKGNTLKSVMEEDLATFRRMSKKIYDTMTQDVSDVLANEQINITQYFNERYNLHMDKMMRTIDEIYRYIPNFDFEKYYTDKDYLLRLYPLPQVSTDPQEIEMQRRQEAYHQLQWMRSEGTRLTTENTHLQNRLKELKKLQKDELMKARQYEEDAETRRNQLENAQDQLQDRLEDLTETAEQTLVQNEQATRMMADARLVQRPKQKTTITKRKLVKKTQPWGVKTAQEIEKTTTEEVAGAAASSISTTSVISKTGAVQKTARPKIKKKPAVPRDPFHFSPIKTPPAGPSAPRETSPFHYSPIRSPPPGSSRPTETSPFHYSPSKSPPGASYPPPREIPEARVPTRTVRVESTTTIVEQAPPSQLPGRAPPGGGRRNLAPRDSWAGF